MSKRNKSKIVEMAKTFAQIEQMRAFEDELISIATQAYDIGVEDGRKDSTNEEKKPRIIRRTRYKVKDYDTCDICGHTGLLHGGSRGCKGVTKLDGYYAEQCGCKVKRDLT